MIEYDPILGGDIKVNVSELERLLWMIDHLIIYENEREFFDYFTKKYLLLTSIRKMEKDYYDLLQVAKRIDDKSSAYFKVLKEYNQFRKQRKELQAELVEIKNSKYSYLL